MQQHAQIFAHIKRVFHRLLDPVVGRQVGNGPARIARQRELHELLMIVDSDLIGRDDL